jgi:hypothetical protein
MKKIAALMGLVSTTAYAAAPQQFYRPGKHEILIELNTTMDTITREELADDADEIGSTSLDLTLARGINENLAVGASVGTQNEGHGGGQKDILLFVNGQHQKYFYGLELALSGDIELDKDNYPENAKSGGLNYTITLGSMIYKNFGIRLDYTPGFTKVVKPISGENTETEVGETLWVKGFYEHELGKHIIGGAFGGLKVMPDESDTDLDEKYNTAELYYQYDWKHGLKFIGGLRYWFGNQRRYFELAREGADLGIRYQF